MQDLLAACAERGVVMRPYDGVRDPWSQGKIWRQSRSIEQITAKIVQLRQAGANFLADAIEQAGPQNGDHVTNAVPGLSWHQWREAADSFWLVDGHAEWDPDKIIDGVNGYHIYAQQAGKFGLTAGGTWSSLADWPHVQLQAAASPLTSHTLKEIDAVMREMWANHPH